MRLIESLLIFVIWSSVLLALLVFFRAWRYRSRPAAKAFLGLMASLIWWLSFSMIEYSSTSLSQHIFWMKMSYFGITSLPVFWLVFCLYYTDKGKWWRRRGLPLLFILPATTMVMAWTNDLHHLMWRNIGLDMSRYPSPEIVVFNTWFWIHAFYSYLLLLIGTFNLFRLYLRSTGIYRSQAGIMLLASFIPWIANFIFIAGIGPSFAIDPTPVAFVITSFSLLGGISRMKLLNIMPVAYEAIFRSIGDGAIVIDERNRIRDVNPAAAAILRADKSELLGKKLSRVIPTHAYSQERIPDSRLTEIILSLVIGQVQRFYKMRVSPIADGQRVSGRLVLLHDDTERRKAENEAKEKALLEAELKARKEMQQALADSSRRLLALSEDSPVMICNTDLDGNINFINKKYEDVTGYRRADILGQHGMSCGMFDDETKLLLQERKKNRLLGEHLEPVEVRYRRRDGKWIWLSMVTELIRENDKPVGFQVISQDITERKRIERLLKDENQVLTMLGEGAELDRVLDSIVRLGEAHDPSIRGSMLLYDIASGRLLLAAAPSLPGEYLALFKDGLPFDPDTGTCDSFACLKERVVVPDIKQSPYFGTSPEVIELTTRYRMLAVWSQPIIGSSGDFLGIIANYADRVGMPDEKNLKVLEWSARIAAIAIEHKRAEVALANEAIRRRILIEQSSDGIVVLDEKGQVYEANQRFADMVGYSMEEVRKLGVWDWEASFPREKVTEMIQSINEKGDHFETKHVRKDGSLYDVEISTNGAVIAGQKLVFCVCRDITERKRAEAALRESEEKFSKAFCSSPNSISISTLKDGVFLEVNDSFTRELGWTREEAIGRSSMSMNIWVNPMERENIMRKLEKNGRVVNEEYSCRTKAGKICNMLFSAETITIAGLPCLLAVTTDITEEREKQERLYLTDRLASVGEMAAGVAHELNNPLTSIIGLSNLLTKQGMSGEMQEDLVAINSEAQRCAAIVKNLLTFARKHAPKRERLQVTRILDDVLKLRAYEHRAQNISVETDFPPDFPEVLADYFQMQQVFLNVILNAESAMVEAHGQGLLKITGEKVNGHVTISFADDGPGIPEENLALIFNPFFTTKEVGKGTGLGLSICYGIVTSHGGKIYAKEPGGKGATFIVELPVVDDSVETGQGGIYDDDGNETILSTHRR